MMTMARRAALAVSTLALAGGGLLGAVQSASAQVATEAVGISVSPRGEITVGDVTAAAPRCQSIWYDNAGPGHGQRLHASCRGYQVRVSIYCDTGSAGWRAGYNKAECPGYGGRATRGGRVDTR